MASLVKHSQLVLWLLCMKSGFKSSLFPLYLEAFLLPVFFMPVDTAYYLTVVVQQRR